MIRDNQQLLNRIHVVIDAGVIAISYILAWYLRFKSGFFELDPWFLSLLEYMKVLVILVPGYLILYYVLEEGEIARIAVAPEYRRQGVGARMLLELENLCEDNGISKLLLEVRESNTSAYSFYDE